MVSYRDSVSLSAAQRAVLFDPASRSLVAAGAGSGKTRLLVAYFVHALLDQSVPLENLAAVTFTRKAGSELTERIRKELVARGRPDLARSIDSATIGTIHGMCRRILAARPLEAEVDPAFGILEPDVERLVKEEVSRKVWAGIVEEASSDELQVLASRGDALLALMLALYERLRGMGHGTPQVHIARSSSEAGNQARGALVDACREALAQGKRLPKVGVALQADLERIASCLQWLGEGAPAEGEHRLLDTTGFFPSRRTPSAEVWLAPVRDALVRYRCMLAEEELEPLVRAVNRLLAAFHEQYEVYKQSRGVLDFADLELRAGRMLAAGSCEGLTGEPVLASHVLVDEFQDTNEVQCAIIDGLRAQRLLLVGDERQSIYSFRGADVEVFRRREEATDLSQHRLDTNYRSRAELLTFINRLFSSSSFFGDGRFKPLLAGRVPAGEPRSAAAPGATGPSAATGPLGATGPLPGEAPTEILVVERTAAGPEEEDLAVQQAEAYAVAERVRRLVDYEGWHQADIVILLPALTLVDRCQDALLAQGLDVYVVRGKGYYSQDEVVDVVALLRLLVNPHDDLALLTALRSPLVGVSDDCLYLLGCAARRGRARSLWEGIERGSLESVAEDDRRGLDLFASHLGRLRARVGRPGLARLIDDAVSAYGYDLCLLAAPQGRRRFANVRKLMRMASDFEDLEGPDLAGFVALVGSLGDLGDDEGNAPSLAEGEEVVRIMTVHQAKGLEFPVVLLAGLGSDPPAYRPLEIVVGNDGRAGALARVSSKEPDRPNWGPAAEIIAEQEARKAEEDLRLLYVAMTRARERLILVGARRAGDKPEARRIGRIVRALGLDVPPTPGVVVRLDDIHAVVAGVAPYAPVEGDAGPAELAAGPSESRVAGPHCPLDLPVPGIPERRVSFSALATYDRCPRRFYLERVLGLGYSSLEPQHGSSSRLPSDESGSPLGLGGPLDDGETRSGLEVGLVVHALLERADLAGPRIGWEESSALAAQVAAEKGLALTPSALRRAVSLVWAFWDSALVGMPELQAAMREAPFFYVHRGISVNGVMDLLIPGLNEWLVVDYKTNALGDGRPADTAESYGLQASMYCLATLKAGAPAVRMEFLFLERPREPVVFQYTRDDEPLLEEQLSTALRGIEQGNFSASIGPWCGDCPVGDLCASMVVSRSAETGSDWW